MSEYVVFIIVIISYSFGYAVRYLEEFLDRDANYDDLELFDNYDIPVPPPTDDSFL